MLPQPSRVDKAEVRGRETLAVVPSMKSFLAVLILGAGASAQAIGPTQRPPQDLRQALQQYQPGGRTPAPRQLTPDERAELRRQLADQGQGQEQEREQEQGKGRKRR